MKSTGTYEHDRALRGIKNFGRGLKVFVTREPRRRDVNGGSGQIGSGPNGGEGCLSGRGHLDVVGDRQVRNAATGQGVTNRNVDQRWQLRRHHNHLVVLRHVHKQTVGGYFLLVPGAEHLGLLHPRQGKDRDMVQLGVVEAVQQVDGAGAGGSHAHPQPASSFGVTARHEGRRLFVLYKYETDPVRATSQALHKTVDAIAR